MKSRFQALQTSAPSLVGATLLAFAALLALASPAQADGFDPDAFGATLTAAESDYVAGDYASARDKYAELQSTLTAALGDGSIPAAQSDAARQALEVIVYQLGRSHQQLSECTDARRVFSELRNAAGLSATVEVKLPARLAEASLCEADQKLSSSDLDGAATALNTADKSLAAADSTAIAEALPAEQAAELESAVEGSRANADALRTQYATARADAATAAADAGQCDVAQAQLAALDPADRSAETQAAVDGCVDPNAAPPETGESIQPWLAIGLMGVGGALVITAVTLEAVNAGDVDDYDAARSSCVGGSSAADCQVALDLADDIETQQILTGTLIGVGVAAIGGGLAWYLLADSGETDTEMESGAIEFTPSLSPNALGGEFKVVW